MIVFGAAYYPEHHPEDGWAQDLDRMVEAGMNLARVGEFGWPCFEPQDGVYDFAWMDRFVELATARDIDIMMCPPLRTVPAWLVDADPSVLTLNSGGTRLAFGSRYTFCIHHPQMIEKGMALAERLAKHYGSHPRVHSWHLDNEYGDEYDCHCPRCQTAWHQWLKEQYGDVETLNQRWGTVFWGHTYTRIDQVPSPKPSKVMHNPALWVSWRRFRSARTATVIGMHRDAIRPHIGDAPVTTNFQTNWNMRTDYFDAAKALDVPGINYYCSFGAGYNSRELGLAVVRGTLQHNVWVVETAANAIHVPGHGNSTPKPGDVSRICHGMIGGGSDAIVLFRWRASRFGAEQHVMSITDWGGRPRRGFEELKNVGATLKRLGPLVSNTKVNSEVAVLYDFPTRWYMEGAYEQPSTPWIGPRQLYMEHTSKLYNAIRAHGVDCDAVGTTSDWSRYRLLVVPILPMVSDDTVAALRSFVEGGGMLVWHPYSGIADPDTSVYDDRLHPGLRELLGFDNIDFAAIPADEPLQFTWNKQSFTGELFFDLPALESAEALAHYTEAPWQEDIAMTSNRVGAGRVIHIGTFAEAAFYNAFFPWCLAEAGVSPLLPAPLPDGVAVNSRSDSSGRRLLFLASCRDTSVTIPLSTTATDHWSGQTVSDSVELHPNQVMVLAP